MAILKHLATLLAIIGALNWGLIGLFDTNVVSAIFGSGSTTGQVIYVLVGLSGIWLLIDWFRKK
ncbi:DUF378 domain-containing protein [Fictibacillus enclensis]|jgi:uncharacterized membrane protein YuzA (DUF378 family)|uniref:DUF378 domain-containing protein n=1 Tax=Fictibacillus TaxID=1329200 RepID=UPI00101381BA|nr:MULTISPECIES: DUF378 domain-containing protein [Fictibacillus]MDM5199055.1 DUF378 domain-containing protein [Fictibacillus enclensis]MDM5338238.1 DUF378 domain-containing protein [Fictibacillus enclensis]RXY99109.1 DUF378 domain-containing protein [Fictibacillus sp. S7]WHY74612.1 DUF378 domain-containing protein [Fictibacillus enclensis]